MTAVSLCYEERGTRNGKGSLLFIAGHGAQLTDWYPELIDSYVARDYHVVTFDNRDAGLSSDFNELGKPDFSGLLAGTALPPYTLDDMADDVAALIERLQLERPLVVAHSLGTMVAQCLAISHPSKVGGMVLIAGTTGNPEVGQPLPDIAKSMADAALHPAPESPPELSEEEQLEASFRSSARWASWDFGMTEELLRERLARRFRRRMVPGGSDRQLAAIIAAPDRTEALKTLEMPTVVIHGSQDPLITVSGGRALAEAIPDAEFLEFPDLSHDLPPPLWPFLVDAVERVRARSLSKDASAADDVHEASVPPIKRKTDLGLG